MPTLYYSPGACSLAVHITLEWIGEPYEVVRVDYSDPEYRQINPAGMVPALEHGGREPLTQCSAILLYLAARHPSADLLDQRTPDSSAQLQRWMAFFTGDMHPAFWPVFMPQRYTLARDAVALSEVKEAGLNLVRTKLGLLEARLAGEEWIVGGKRTVVDAYATPMLNWATSMLPEGLNQYQACRAHHERMHADPAVRRVLRMERG